MNSNKKMAHYWVNYVNPRNKKVHVKACDHCGKLKTGAVSTMICDGIHSTNLLVNRGWQKVV